MNELNKLYSAMWKSWNGVVEDNGKMMVKVGEEKLPITIDGQELYLGLSELIDSKSGNKVFFHPACENITSKETEVFKVIRKVTAMKLLFTFMRYPAIIIPIAGRKPKKAWRQDIVDILQPLKNVKKPVIAEISKLFQLMTIENDDEANDCRFIHIKTTKAGVRSPKTGAKVYYTAKPSFPFYNELAKKLTRSTGVSENQEVEVLGTTISMAALGTIVHLFECCIPGVNNPDDYTFESYDPVASRLTAYLGCYSLVAEDLNRIQNIFREDFDTIGPGRIYLDWIEQLDQLPDIWRQIPTMDYNSHNTQQEVDVKVSRVNGLFDITSTNNNNGAVQQTQQNQSQTTTVAQGNIVSTPQGDFDVSQPMMLNGDSYSHYELDLINMRVRHFAYTPSRQLVVYVCSRQGNFLQKEFNQGLVPGMNMGGMGVMGMGGDNPLLQQQLLQQQLMNNPVLQQQLKQQQALQQYQLLQQMQQMGQPSVSTSVVSSGSTENWHY